MIGVIASAIAGAYPETMLRYPVGAVLLGGLVAGAPVQAVASANLPDMHGAAIVLSAEEGVLGIETVSRCLTEAGMRVAEPAAYLAHFSRAVRPRKMVVELGEGDAPTDAIHRRVRWGRTVETAALAISEISSGKVVLRVEARRKLRRDGKGAGLVLTDLCKVIQRSVGVAPRQG